MKTLILIAVLAVGGWFLYGWLQKQATPEKIQSSAPVRYAKDLQNDVKKTEDVAAKANAAIKQDTQDAQKLYQETDGK